MIKKPYDFRQVAVADALLQAEVTREEMAQELRQAAARFTAIAPVAGPVQNGDVVTLEFADSKLPEGVRRVYANVGKGFSDMEEPLPGHCVEDTVVIAYAGREVSARILAIKRPCVPELTDDHVRQLGIQGVDTLSQLEDHLFQKLAEGQRKRKFRGIMGIVSKAILENTEFEPLDETHPWFRALHGQMMRRVEAFAVREGKTVEEALPMALRMGDASPDACRQALKEMCMERARRGALGQAYAQENGIVYTEEESVARLRAEGERCDEIEAVSDLIARYVDYLSQVVYEYFAPRIQVRRN